MKLSPRWLHTALSSSLHDPLNDGLDLANCTNNLFNANIDVSREGEPRRAPGQANIHIREGSPLPFAPGVHLWVDQVQPVTGIQRDP